MENIIINVGTEIPKNDAKYFSREEFKDFIKDKTVFNSNKYFDDFMRDNKELLKDNAFRKGSSHKWIYSKVVVDNYLNYYSKYKYIIKDLTTKSGYKEGVIKNLFSTVLKSLISDSGKPLRVGSVFYYTQEVLNALITYQHKAHGNVENKEIQNQITAQIFHQADQARDINLIITSGNVEAFDDFSNRLRNYCLAVKNEKEQKEILQIENKNLTTENTKLKHILKYDKTEDWLPWGVWKKENNIDFGKDELFSLAELVYGKDFEEIYTNEKCRFKGTVINPKTAVPKLMNWINNNRRG